jgi:hypothetical protein
MPICTFENNVQRDNPQTQPTSSHILATYGVIPVPRLKKSEKALRVAFEKAVAHEVSTKMKKEK